MIGEALRAVDGLVQYPVAGLLLFVVIFALVLIRVIRMDDAYVRRLSRLPLDGVDAIEIEPGAEDDRS